MGSNALRCGTVLLVLLAAGVGRADGPPAATDRFGDALPVGAVARLGTLRLRPGSYPGAVAFTPDGKVLASDNWGFGIHLWDVATGKQLRFFAGQHSVRSLTFSADGNWLAGAVVNDPVIRLWEVATGKELRQFIGHTKGRLRVAFSPGGPVLASGCMDATVRLWDAASGRELRRLTGHKGEVWCLGWSADGKTLASGGDDGAIRLWEADTGRLLRELTGHKDLVARLAWSPDGKTLASGGSDGTVRLWDVGNGTARHILGTAGDTRGRRLANEDPFIPMGNPNAVGDLGCNQGLAFSADGTMLFSGSQEYRPILVWDVATGQERSRLPGKQRVFCLALSADGKTLAVGGADAQIDLWDVATGKPLLTFDGPRGRIFCAVFSPDGKVLATGGDDPAIRLWRTDTWQEIGQLAGHRSYLRWLTFSPDGKFLAGVGGDHAVRVWDLATGRQVHAWVDHELGGINAVTFSPDSTMVAATWHGVTVWEVASGKELQRFDRREEEPRTAQAVAFSPDGRALAVGGYKTIHLCDPRTGKVLRLFEPQKATVNTLAFSADGKILFSGGPDKQVHCWEVATGMERCALTGHQMSIRSLALSPAGRLLASASGGWRDHDDDSARVWDVATGQELRRFTAHRGTVAFVAFSPDGKTLATASEDTTVLLWDVASLKPAVRPVADDLSVKEQEAAWNALAEGHAMQAYKAMQQLLSRPTQTAAFVRERLRPVVVDNQEVVAWIADLDGARFATRTKAAQALEQLGEAVEPALRKALEGQPSLNLRREVLRLLQRLHGTPSGERLRELRAVEVLERLGTAAARQVLESLARGDAAARLTQEAWASLARMAR
jgi:WD40 repeat protein